MIDRADLLEALAMLEAAAPGAALQIGTITSETHAIAPLGAGVFVSVHPSPPGRALVWEKASTFVEAARRAIARLR